MTHRIQPHGKKSNFAAPATDEIIAYLQAFFHGVEVRRLPDQLSWVPWAKNSAKETSNSKIPAALPREVGLKSSDEIIRVRLRQGSSSKKSKSGLSGRKLFRYQVNQLDLLDVAEAVLPAEAYCLLLVVNHDLYEDEDDDFCCGRAFGGSRIAVVSSARYDPALDELQELDRDHGWPVSHCADFVAQACEGHVTGPTSRKRRNTEGPGLTQGALHGAVKSQLDSTFDTRTTYLLRVCRSASHEIGHCFGIDHCMYYACVMQGTCSLPEDNRQPPYLCPVCEAKVGHAVTKGRANSVAGWKLSRHEATLKICNRMGGAFEPLSTWTRSILAETECS